MSLPKKLTVDLQGDADVVFQRYFDAPPAFVYDCNTKPDLVQRWLTGPDGWSFSTCRIDLRVGGEYLFVWQKEGESSFGFGGVYKEIKAPEIITNTEIFIPDPTQLPSLSESSQASVNTLQLAAAGKGTLMTLTCRYPSAEIRKMALETGMEEGMEISYVRLDEMCLQAGRK